MKRVFGILFILLVALALGMSVGDLRAEGVSMRLAYGNTPSAGSSVRVGASVSSAVCEGVCLPSAGSAVCEGVCLPFAGSVGCEGVCLPCAGLAGWAYCSSMSFGGVK